MLPYCRWYTNSTMSGTCPQCGQTLLPADINISQGVALCPSCGKLARVDETLDAAAPLLEQLLEEKPAGCTITYVGEHEIRLRATLRSVGGICMSLFLCLFWNGIVSVFVLIALCGLYTNLVGPLPAWFPQPNMQDEMALGETLFLCLFLTPFVVVGTGMFGALLLYLVGSVEVRLLPEEGQVRTGIGSVVWVRRFDPNQVAKIEPGVASWESNGQAQPVIVIQSRSPLKFGSLLRADRRLWLQDMLKALLVGPQRSRERRKAM